MEPVRGCQAWTSMSKSSAFVRLSDISDRLTKTSVQPWRVWVYFMWGENVDIELKQSTNIKWYKYIYFKGITIMFFVWTSRTQDWICVHENLIIEFADRFNWENKWELHQCNFKEIWFTAECWTVVTATSLTSCTDGILSRTKSEKTEYWLHQVQGYHCKNSL